MISAALVAGACSSKPHSVFSELGAAEPAAPSTTSATAPATTVASPLTGGRVAAAIAARPAVIVKVDNSPDARPQAGLNDADVIYEERVEGSVVRFLAVFGSKDAAVVGPVRSVRSTDAGVVAPIGGVFAYSGGIVPFRDRVAATGIVMVPEDADASAGVYKRAGKVRPYATYANTMKLRLHAKGGAPPALFARSAEGTPFATANPGATTITGVRVVFGSLTTADWTWDGAKHLWLRSTNNTAHVLEDGSRLSTSCLILETVPYRPTQYTDRSNAGVDEAVITGSGKALVACDGQVVEARWQKPTLKSVITYVNAATGAPITIPAGRVWVSLVPTNGVITTKTPTVATALPAK
jgi:hypothetical protein